MPNGKTLFGSANQVVLLTPGGCAEWQQKRFTTAIYITKTHIRALDQPSRRCSMENTAVDTSACIAGFIERELGCNAMTLGSQYLKGTPCTTRSQLLAFSNISKILEKSDENDIYGMTGCLSSCEKDRFSISADPLVTETAYGEWGEVPCQLHMEFRILDSSYKVEEQYMLYEMDSFIADVGGYMGLLLGFSLLSLYIALEDCMRKIAGMRRVFKTQHGNI